MTPTRCIQGYTDLYVSGKLGKGVKSGLLIMEDISNSNYQSAIMQACECITHDVSLLLESASFRSFIWAFWVALNWFLSCSRRIYRRRSDCGDEEQGKILMIAFTYILVHVMHEQEESVVQEEVK